MTKVKIVALPAGKNSISVVMPKTTMEPEKSQIDGLSGITKRLSDVMYPTLVPLDDEKQAGSVALNPSLTKAQAAIKLPSSVEGINYINQMMYGVTGSAEKPGLLNVSNAKKDLRAVVNDVHQKYVNKINSTTDPNEKLYALDQIKKMFGDTVPLNDDGSFGTIGQMMEKVKSNGKAPLVNDDLAARMGRPASKINWDNPAIKQMRYDPTLNDDMMGDDDAEKTFNNAVQVYEKDPLFRDDAAKPDYIAKKETAMVTFQDEKNKAIIDQVNIGITKNFMETYAGKLGLDVEHKNSMINTFFIPLGKAGAGKEKYAVKSFDQHLNELKENPNINKAANMLADMAIRASERKWKAPVQYDAFGRKLTATTSYEDVFDRLGGNRGSLASDDIFEEFEGQAQHLLGMDENFTLSKFKSAWYTERDVASLVNQLNEKGIDGKKILADLYIKKWAKGGTEGSRYRDASWLGMFKPDYQSEELRANTSVRVNPDLELAENSLNFYGVDSQQKKEFYDAYADVPIAGYEQFREAYGKALTHKDLPISNYTVNFAGIKGQGGKGAVSNKVNIDASLPLSMNATGNQWAISVIDNLIPNIAGKFDENGKYSMDKDNIDDREDLKYNQKVYVFDKPLKEVREELDAGDERDYFGVENNVEDWDWSNSWGNLTDKTLDGLHIDALNNNAAAILAAYRHALYNQEDVGQASNDARATGELVTYPIALNAEDMTGYEIKISGKWLKKKGFQTDTEDKIFSMAIPKGMANNLAYKAVESKDDMVDRAIIANGSYTIKNPGGDATLTMDDKGNYVMNGSINTFDANSGMLKTTILQPKIFPSMAFEGSKVAETIKQILINQQRNIEAIQNSNRANSQNKIFDPQQLLEQLLQQ